MNYMLIEKASISNGPGFRVVLWVSGCSMKCKNCHNQNTWDFGAGYAFDEKAKRVLFAALEKPWIKGITFSGGHPLEPQSTAEIAGLISEICCLYPSKDIWLYTGRELNIGDFERGGEYADIIAKCDVVVDGPYIDSLRDVTLPFRGSSNQRLIDVQKSLSEHRIVLYKTKD